MPTEPTAPGHSLLVVGWSKVGKTVLAVQLILRIRKSIGLLSFRAPPPNLSLIATATADLSDGRAPQHTPANVLSDLTLPLDGPVDLVWPDYGGEQVRKMVGETRRLPDGWRERVEAAGGWLLLVRPGLSRDFEDILSRPFPDLVAARRAGAPPASDAGSGATSKATKSGGLPALDADGVAKTDGTPEVRGEHDPSSTWSDQSLLIEILQILREVRGPSAFRPETAPVLAVALTCWDELYAEPGCDPRPDDVLRARYPLLASFIEANWAEGRRTVYGLSSQGQNLSETVPDEAYAALGPEEHGFIVSPVGERDGDLTRIIADVIGRLTP